MAQELRIDRGPATEQLVELCRRGLMERSEAPERFRYAPQRPEVDALVARLEAAYEDHRVSVIALIYSTPRPRVQAFADAFWIRRDDDG